MNKPFARKPNVIENTALRIPQRQGYAASLEHFSQPNSESEVSIILPVGCGKSGLIGLIPFAAHANRVLVVAPGVRIASQLMAELDATSSDCFYTLRNVVPDGYPDVAEIRGDSSNVSDLDFAHIVVTNIQQLQGSSNRWLKDLPSDYFDLILVDEGHHNVAESWVTLRKKFSSARIVNFSATPTRADGKLMTGRIIYTFPVISAIKAGYIKRLKGIILNPSSLALQGILDAN